MPKNGDMEQHLTKLMQYYDELCDIDHVIDDHQFVSIVMTSVGEDYDNLITALDCRDEEHLTFELVKSKLLDEYERKVKNDYFATEGESLAGLKNYAKKYCDFCKEPGHVKKFCGKFDSWLAERKKKDENAARAATEQKLNLVACGAFDDESDDDGYEYLF